MLLLVGSQCNSGKCISSSSSFICCNSNINNSNNINSFDFCRDREEFLNVLVVLRRLLLSLKAIWRLQMSVRFFNIIADTTCVVITKLFICLQRRFLSDITPLVISGLRETTPPRWQNSLLYWIRTLLHYTCRTVAFVHELFHHIGIRSQWSKGKREAKLMLMRRRQQHRPVLPVSHPRPPPASAPALQIIYLFDAAAIAVR